MHIVIIGNGISGVTAARHLRKLSDHKITIVSGETDYFFSRTALMYVYMGHMRWTDIEPYEPWFWKKNRIDLKKGWVKTVNTQNKSLLFDNGESLSFDKLILATGSKPNKFGWPGQDLDGVHGLYSRQDLEALERHSEQGIHHAVIVGGGLIGIELAEMFHSRHIPVTFLVREKAYWDIVLPLEESRMVSKHILENGIDLRLETELKEIQSDENGKVKGVVTNKGAHIPCNYVGLTAGVSPNIDFIRSSDIELGRGIIINEYFETNIPDIYAIGDCAQLKAPLPGRRPIEAIWYTGRMMGETLAHNICGNKIAYNPGIWFNSAKFFDIEYQVYGTVITHPPANHKQIYWQHPDGKKSIRIIYDEDTKIILGFNLMGVRYRHEVCEKWIKEQTPIEDVLQQLGLANFDPELYTEYEQEVISIYNKQSGSHLKLRKKRSLNNVLSFLSVS